MSIAKQFLKNPNVAKTVFVSLIAFSLSGLINSSTALILGLAYALIFNNFYLDYSKKAISTLLKIAVVGLGFGMQLGETITTTKSSFSLTLFSILITIILGTLIGRFLKIDKKLSHLISSGTAICGGSAIAAIAPVIKAKSEEISIAIGLIFILNSIALLIFPFIGHLLNLSQSDFGLWAAVAIHDTSSVVGAALAYGDEALKVATTVKLSRTLWIIPLSIFSMFMFKSKGEKIKIPYFIFLFIAAIFINSYDMLPSVFSSTIVLISKRLLIATLFLVGSTISIQKIKETGLKPMLLAISIWVIISVFSLSYILL